jgi:5'-3' exonuclease
VLERAAGADLAASLASRMPPRPLLAVDRPNLLFRAWFALPDSITDAEGHPTNALLGTANLILQAVERHDPRAVVLCDGAEAAVYRKELLPQYHADRPELPEGLARQFADSEDFFGAFGWTTLVHDTLEADDLLGSLARVETEAGGRTLLYTGDRDMFQCAGDDVTVLYPGGKQGPTEIGPREVRQRYGIPPELVPDFIALRGDPSDGIPGGTGIGEKTARDLLLEHGTLEGAIANAIRERPRVQKALREEAGRLHEFKEIATLVDVPMERPADRETDFAGGAAAARARGMNRLAERLDRLAGA